ncbi:hypothetical protein Y1Q_0010575 [Alligator mississippiensis]|uniref:Uncharacterized protein n=1 Tax=Alligator mississippiensis TaxID=8496 RepID=A0A151NKH9_ALLMI|nr:hypothetical protein Y1Q_0010575 [Alligator mississippiensis]
MDLQKSRLLLRVQLGPQVAQAPILPVTHPPRINLQQTRSPPSGPGSLTPALLTLQQKESGHAWTSGDRGMEEMQETTHGPRESREAGKDFTS